MSRPTTPDRVADDGTTTITLKRACNGCGTPLGDVTQEEMRAGMDGRRLPDVRDECPTCDYTPPTDVRQYPVIVETVRRFVVWVEADNPDDAVEQFHADPFDPDDDAQLSFDHDVSKPDRYDWHHIRDTSEWGWSGTQADAHVKAHKRHLQRIKAAECKAAGHPIPDDATGPWRWKNTCGTCGTIDPTERTAHRG